MFGPQEIVEAEDFARPRWTDSCLSPDRLNTKLRSKPNRRTCAALARKRTFAAETMATAMRNWRPFPGATNVGNATYCPLGWFYLLSTWVCSFTTLSRKAVAGTQSVQRLRFYRNLIKKTVEKRRRRSAAVIASAK